MEQKKKPPLGPVIKLHQAYEGENFCLYCGKEMPWPTMDDCLAQERDQVRRGPDGDQ